MQQTNKQAVSAYKNQSGWYNIIGEDFILRIYDRGFSLLKVHDSILKKETETIQSHYTRCDVYEAVEAYDKVSKVINGHIESINPFAGVVPEKYLSENK